MASKKITELTDATLPLGGSEYIETVQGGVNKKAPASAFGVPLTREVNRAFSETLLFDKNEIEVEQHTMTDDITFVISPSGNLANQVSSMVMEVVADGVHAINFTSTIGESFTYIYPAGIVSGVILDAGTYEIYIWYQNGKARVNIPGVSAETSSLIQLTAPGNFAVVADGENALDFSWDDVSNESSYQIERSLTGTGGWTVFSTPAAGVTSGTETGLSAGDTVFYRIKAIGDGVTYADSPYSTASGTTEDSGDVTAPTFTFNPANGNAVWTVNRPLTITANEELRNAADGSAIDSSDLATIITLKETDSSGANIAFTATIDATKTIITVTPTAGYGASQLVYLAIDDVEDVSGNEITLQSITFTTTDKTYHNGTSNRTAFGDILDSLFAANDTEFWIEITTNNTLTSGGRHIVSKYSSVAGERCFSLYYVGSDMYFTYWGAVTPNSARVIKWANALDGAEHDWVLRYDGSIDTNHGRDRCILLKDGVVVGDKTLDFQDGALVGSLVNATSQLAVGSTLSSGGVASGFFTEELSGFKIKSAGGTVTEIDVPVLFYGEDVSGNNRDGTWV